MTALLKLGERDIDNIDVALCDISDAEARYA